MPRWSGETCWTAKTIIDHVLCPALSEQETDPTDIATIERILDTECSHNWFAKAAIEMACWDIKGKVAGKPVYQLLGGPHRSLEIPARFSMAAYDPETAAQKAVERLGFTEVSFTLEKVETLMGATPLSPRKPNPVPSRPEPLPTKPRVITWSTPGWTRPV